MEGQKSMTWTDALFETKAEVLTGFITASIITRIATNGLWLRKRSKPRKDHALTLPRVSRMRSATTTPEANVKAATSQIAACRPSASAVTPASSAPTA